MLQVNYRFCPDKLFIVFIVLFYLCMAMSFSIRLGDELSLSYDTLSLKSSYALFYFVRISSTLLKVCLASSFYSIPIFKHNSSYSCFINGFSLLCTGKVLYVNDPMFVPNIYSTFLLETCPI